MNKNHVYLILSPHSNFKFLSVLHTVPGRPNLVVFVGDDAEVPGQLADGASPASCACTLNSVISETES